MAGFHSKSDNHIDSNLSQRPPISEMNVTPLVDVMLVLLIIFMVSAPLMQQGIQVDLPKTKSPSLDEQEKPVVLVLKKSGSMEINGNVVSNSSLSEKLRSIYARRQRKEIFIQADHAIPYGTVATVMSLVQAAGIAKIGLVTEPQDSRR